jgi:hypothetical protein
MVKTAPAFWQNTEKGSAAGQKDTATETKCRRQERQEAPGEALYDPTICGSLLIHFAFRQAKSIFHVLRCLTTCC